MLILVLLFPILFAYLSAKTVILLGVGTLYILGIASLIYFSEPKEKLTRLFLGVLLILGLGLFINKASAQNGVEPGVVKHLLHEFRQDGHYKNLAHSTAGITFRDEANPLTLNFLLSTGTRPIVARFREGERIQIVPNYNLDRRVFVFSEPVTKHHLEVLSVALGFDSGDELIYSLIAVARRRAGVTKERFDSTRFAQNDMNNLLRITVISKDSRADATATNDSYHRVSGELWRRKQDLQISDDLKNKLDHLSFPKKEKSGEYAPRP